MNKPTGMKDIANERYSRTVDGVYYSHQPIYGYRSKYSAPCNISRYIIIHSILREMSRYRFHSFLDVGGAEGWTVYLVRKIFPNCFLVANSDISAVAVERGRQLFGMPGVSCVASRVSQFGALMRNDIVLSSEVLEHVPDWRWTLQNILKVTNGVAIITVPHEKHNKSDNRFDQHINFFDEHSLDYLKGKGYIIRVTKTLSPFLVPFRVIAEGQKKDKVSLDKHGNVRKLSLAHRLYNALTPVFRAVFGVRTAIFLVNLDRRLCRLFPNHFGGLTFTIEKRPVMARKPIDVRVEDFIFRTIKPKKDA